jgi:hypothetical protein
VLAPPLLTCCIPPTALWRSVMQRYGYERSSGLCALTLLLLRVRNGGLACAREQGHPKARCLGARQFVWPVPSTVIALCLASGPLAPQGHGKHRVTVRREGFSRECRSLFVRSALLPHMRSSWDVARACKAMAASDRVTCGPLNRVRPRMESTGVPGRIQVSEHTWRLLPLAQQLRFEERGQIEVKGKVGCPVAWPGCC